MAVMDRLLSDFVGADADTAFGRLLAGELGGTHTFLPPADVYETENEIVVELDVPGLNPENLSAEVVNRQLVVTGERQSATDVGRWFRKERWSGRFVRTFALAASDVGGEVHATYDNGVLTLRMAKPEEAKPKRIAISTTDQKQIESSK